MSNTYDIILEAAKDNMESTAKAIRRLKQIQIGLLVISLAATAVKIVKEGK